MIGKSPGHYPIACRYPLSSALVWLVLGVMAAQILLTILVFPSEPEHSPVKHIVTKLADTDDGVCDADCSLREALGIAAPDDMVGFASALTGTIKLGSTLIINKNVTINGPNAKAIVISGNNAVRVFYVDNGAHFTIRNLTVMKGYVKGANGSNGKPCEPGASGGAAQGGGLYNRGGRVTIINSTFSDNRALGGSGGTGGSYQSSILDPSRCNMAQRGGFGGDGMGGAVFNGGALLLINSTFSGNKALGGYGGGGGYASTGRGATPNAGLGGDGGCGLGGAVYSPSHQYMHVSNCTFANNSASGATYGVGSPHGKFGNSLGGAIYNTGSNAIKNTVIAKSISGGNCVGSIISEGHNLDSDGTCGLTGTGDLTKIDPKLGLLKNNGGPTYTHALQPGSPAINAGNPAGCADQNGAEIPADQRGRGRSGRCDIGSFEFSDLR
jgi:CSLREA domain-containing protein